MLEMKSTTTNIFFKQQKIESRDAFSIFLTFHLFIFFCSSCLFYLQASTEDYKDMHLRFVVHLRFLLWTSFYFWFFKRNGTVLDVFYLDLMVSWLYLMFQVFKCLKWRVQPQSSVLPPKNWVWRCFIFFSELSSVHILLFIMFLLFTGFNWRWVWHASFLTTKNRVWRCFIYFSDLSSVHLLLFIIFLLFTVFNWRVQTHSSNIFLWSSFSFVDNFFFWFLNRTGMVLYVFYWDLMVSWLHLMFQVFKCLKWRVQPQTSFLNRKKSSL